MIINITQTVGRDGDETFDRKRAYAFYCVDHSSSIEQLITLKTQLIEAMRQVVPFRVELEDEGHYEGNLSWSKLTMYYPNFKIEIDENYNGLWEMKSFGRLRSDAQLDVGHDMLDWLVWHIDEGIEDIK